MHRMLRAGVAVALLIAFAASAQTVPNKPLRMVAGMAAGGGADVNARRLSQALGKLLKQNVVIENIAGGAGKDIAKIGKPYAAQLEQIGRTVEQHFKEIRSIRFTVENKRLWLIDQRPVMSKSTMADIKMLLEGAIAALGKVGLILNVERKNLDAVISILPALKNPTISPLADDKWVAVNTILDETTVRTIIPRLKQAGASGIVEYPLNKIIE